jgi:hypothetical protein
MGLVQCRSHSLALCSKSRFLDLIDKTVHAKVQAILACCFFNLRAMSLFTSKHTWISQGYNNIINIGVYSTEQCAVEL